MISIDGGNSPLWSPDGSELFYRNDDATIAVPVEAGPSLKLGNPEVLFRQAYISTWRFATLYTPWDISPNDKRFLMIKPEFPEGDDAYKINIVLNWFEELKQKVPTD